MSFLATIRVSSRQAIRTNFAVPASTFHSSAVRNLNEDDRSRENLSYHYEFHKQEGIKNTKEGKGKWKSELASNSEAGVKADRGELDDDMSFREMQEKTKHVKTEKINKQ
ncbi:putative mitochondrial carrier protein pet8 [Penicillium digitatum]|uniref:Mitochondrial carrier protein PET8 n=3 Tax=Penicillium digitatum TaxID=36651 RepID=K9FYE9_PEND2|nr:hypothetical protein PDIP_80680 [Penicillium digitatum Pd1]EKV06038.1 hypothetical protein PDIP_80680 [Penicillium digitatum Pd1]EKV07708.1 hypothetical protein PDIG_71380 [Penicillium digitatum PHI26]KAG0161182.1 hypothetical protein PDIDSM_8716 [Penicillium digitatum]QQK40549.1 putative mitochondrial carrier protein pet8 [Penicillium digitatum]